MIISVIALSSVAGWAFYCGMRIWREVRQQRMESRMCRQVRLAFLN